MIIHSYAYPIVRDDTAHHDAPNFDGSVFRASHSECFISSKRHTGHGRKMTFKVRLEITNVKVPQLSHIVLAT